MTFLHTFHEPATGCCSLNHHHHLDLQDVQGDSTIRPAGSAPESQKNLKKHCYALPVDLTYGILYIAQYLIKVERFNSLLTQSISERMGCFSFHFSFFQPGATIIRTLLRSWHDIWKICEFINLAALIKRDYWVSGEMLSDLESYYNSSWGTWMCVLNFIFREIFHSKPQASNSRWV